MDQDLREPLERLFRARYLMLRPWLPGGGNTGAVIAAEDALHRAYLGPEADGEPDGRLYALAAKKAGQALWEGDEERAAPRRARRAKPDVVPVTRKRRNLFD